MPDKSLYLVARTDAGKEQCWGDNLDMVVCSNGDEHLEMLIRVNLLTNNVDRPADKGDDGMLTRDDIKVTLLGKAEDHVQLGVVLLSNAGA